MERLIQEQTELLNGLIRINSDRIAEYEHALEDLDGENADLRPLFYSLINQSGEIKMQLKELLQSAGEEPEDGIATGEKNYQSRLNINVVFSDGRRIAVLEACEGGEDAIQKAYDDALNKSLPAGVADILIKQQKELKQSHDRIKILKDLK